MPTEIVCSAERPSARGGDDFVILGDALPSWTLGFRTGGNWNKFDFSMLVNSQQGMKVLNETALVYATKSNAKNNKNFLASALNDGVGTQASPRFSPTASSKTGRSCGCRTSQSDTPSTSRASPDTARSTRVYLSGDNLLLGTTTPVRPRSLYERWYCLTRYRLSTLPAASYNYGRIPCRFLGNHT